MVRARLFLAEQQLPLFKTNIRRLVAFQKAALAGVPVSDVVGDPRASEGWNDYKSSSSGGASMKSKFSSIIAARKGEIVEERYPLTWRPQHQ